jgi:hypothetical protein
MLLRELYDKTDDFKDIDLIDDLKFFMNNDPAFYRKVLFPEISKLKDSVKGGNQCSEMHFKPCVDKAVGAYCKKFKIEKNPSDLFNDEEIRELAEKMYHEEKENINKGAYDRREK